MGLGWLAIMISAPVGGDCPPSAIVRGEPAICEAVRGELDRRGILETSEGRCTPYEVELLAKNREVLIALTTKDGQSVERTARSASMAATIIESFVREDVAAPLLEHALPEKMRTPIEPLDLAGDDPAPPDPVTDQATARPFAISAGLIFGAASDGSTWAGADARACFRASIFCFGGRLQYAEDMRNGGDAVLLSTDRTMVTLAATMELPIVLGALELVPGLSAGHGVVGAERDVGALDASEDAAGLRLGATLGLSWRFSSRWSVRGDVALDYAPYARRELSGSVIDQPERVALAGEPPSCGWVRIALEVGRL